MPQTPSFCGVLSRTKTWSPATLDGELKLKWASFVLAFTVLTLCAFAQDNHPAEPTALAPQVNVSPGVTDAVTNFIAPLVVKYPWIATFIGVMTVCRLLLKPTFTYLHSIADATPTQWDNNFLAKVEISPAYKWTVWVLDFLFSIKLVHPNADSAKATNPPVK